MDLPTGKNWLVQALVQHSLENRGKVNKMRHSTTARHTDMFALLHLSTSSSFWVLSSSSSSSIWEIRASSFRFSSAANPLNKTGNKVLVRQSSGKRSTILVMLHKWQGKWKGDSIKNSNDTNGVFQAFITLASNNHVIKLWNKWIEWPDRVIRQTRLR